MELLIDTQAILWFQNSDQKLSDKAKGLIENKANTCFLSVASLWEIAIKVNLKKLEIGMEFGDFSQHLISMDFTILDVKVSHLKILSQLNNIHRDPFDRLIIAQAISENLTIISADRHFEAYPVQVIW